MLIIPYAGDFADIARRGISSDLDLGELRTPFDAVALHDPHARNESGGRCGGANETLVGDEPARDRGLARVAGDGNENDCSQHNRCQDESEATDR